MIDLRGVYGRGYYILTEEARTKIHKIAGTTTNFDNSGVQVLAAPGYGADFSTDFSMYLVGANHNGGMTHPGKDSEEFFAYVLEGSGKLTKDGETHDLSVDSYAYIPPNTSHQIANDHTTPLKFLVVKRTYIPAGSGKPSFICGNARTVQDEHPFPELPGLTRKVLMPYENITYDMSVATVTCKPGAGIQPKAADMHIQHHGLYVLEGEGLQMLGRLWHQVKKGDFIYFAPFIPQMFYCTGYSQATYFLYKDWLR